MTGQRSQRCGLPLESHVSLVAMVMLLLVTPTSAAPKRARAAVDETTRARQWLDQMNAELAQVTNNATEAQWAYATNITQATQRASTAASLKQDKFYLTSADTAAQFDRERVTDPTLALELKRLADKGTVLKDPEKAKKYHQLMAEMEGIFSTAKVCLNSTQHPDCMPLDPDLYRILKSSRDWDELVAVWKGWRDVSGAKMRTQYQEMVELVNEGARDNGHTDAGDAWRANYESETFQADVAALWEELLPLYRQVHTYVRRKLKEVYGPHRFPATGHIPAHILGEMWSMQWHVYNLVQPFKMKQAIDVTPALKAQNYTVEKMFRLAESFYESLGMEPMTDTFWKSSMLSKPTDGRDVVCYASAWDFFKRDDFRIKMCTDITMEDLVTIHHEMGHVQYYMQYKVQPPFFRSGANNGFHEAIGDTIALSVMTPQHLHKVGLLDEIKQDNETDINFLMKMALEKIAFLPFGYLIDQWRWSVFSGDTTSDHYNEKWWELRCRYQGLSAPVARSEKDFDPGCKYHVAANVPYIRYFVSYVIQFQFHQALCREAGHQGPLHTCDIYNSKEAGEKLMAMLRLGSSKPWPDVLEVMTGTRQMQASALLDYFRPLQDWLEEQNKEDNLGWTNQCPDPATGKVTDEEEARRFLEKMERETQDVDTNDSLASWRYVTNLTDENLQASKTVGRKRRRKKS